MHYSFHCQTKLFPSCLAAYLILSKLDLNTLFQLNLLCCCFTGQTVAGHAKKKSAELCQQGQAFVMFSFSLYIFGPFVPLSTGIHLTYCCPHTRSPGLCQDTNTELNSCIREAAKQNDSVIVPLRQYMAPHFLLCPLLHFMARTSHAAVSSSHTVEVHSSLGEVTCSPS